jgi:hypothetical protein
MKGIPKLGHNWKKFNLKKYIFDPRGFHVPCFCPTNFHLVAQQQMTVHVVHNGDGVDLDEPVLWQFGNLKNWIKIKKFFFE